MNFLIWTGAGLNCYHLLNTQERLLVIANVVNSDSIIQALLQQSVVFSEPPLRFYFIHLKPFEFDSLVIQQNFENSFGKISHIKFDYKFLNERFRPLYILHRVKPSGRNHSKNHSCSQLRHPCSITYTAEYHERTCDTPNNVRDVWTYSILRSVCHHKICLRANFHCNLES